VSSDAPTRSAVSDPRRLAALVRTGLLDARPSDTFDRLTALATQLLGVPVALVSLVDDDRQFFVSCPGLDEPWATARETPLSHSFCQYVVATGEPLVVEDARNVDYLRTNLAIRDLGVIAYAGVPLRLATGEILGSFCAIENEPRVWTPAELESLKTLADAAMAELDLRETSRLLAERESQLRLLLDNSEELVCSFGPHGEIVYVNRAWCETLGYSAEEAVELDIMQLVAPAYRESFMGVVGNLRAGRTVPTYEAEMIARDGRFVFCRGQAMPTVENGDVRRIDVLFFDVTAAREAERARAEADRMKSELIGIVSHELRSPLTAIRGALRLLEKHVPAEDARTRQLTAMASRGADRLLRIVEDLLDIERAEGGVAALDRHVIGAQTLLDDARDAVRVAADDAAVEIVVSPTAVTVDADADRLIQVLVNLVGNSVKFTPAGGTITLSASRSEQTTTILVRDTGRGIPPEKLEAIFARFQQVMPEDASVKHGAGLGLAISRALVAQHGGEIWATNNAEGGSTFHLTIPDRA
jgi:PAS domain S-box-containing protein